jgi:hypothetical protein
MLVKGGYGMEDRKAIPFFDCEMRKCMAEKVTRDKVENDNSEGK